MPHLTEADLDAIRQRAEKAARGPWESRKELVIYSPPGVPHSWYTVAEAKERLPGTRRIQSLLDAEFIANARTDIPQLLAAIDERDKVIHDMMEESDARRLAQRYRDVIKAVKDLIRGWQGESSIAERIVFKLIDEVLEGNP